MACSALAPTEAAPYDQDARAYDGPNRREARFRLAGMYVVSTKPPPRSPPRAQSLARWFLGWLLAALCYCITRTVRIPSTSILEVELVLV